MAEVETTLILFKPDAITNRICGKVLARFEEAGLRIAGMKMFRCSEALLKEHYAHIADKPFFPNVQQFMQRTPVIAVALEGPRAVTQIRELLGPTDSTKAAQGTIRGDFGVDVMVNVCHASDSPESAAAELNRFFRKDELFDY
jgi:nucleoside-diphosphate kinase